MKSAAKKTPAIQKLPHVKVFNVTDDAVFGTVIIELLASPIGRKELDKEFSKRFKRLKFEKSLAERLYYHHLAQYEGRIPRLDEVCEKRTDKGWHFVPANLKAWLARREISAEDQRTLSFYACYLALREPEQAEAILKVFINHDAAFLNWLSDGEVPSKSPTAALPTDSAELVQLLTSSSDWDRELPINQLRSAIYLLTRKAERHANRLHDFDETRHRVSALLEKVAQIPWLEGDLPIDQYLSLFPNISVEGALEHFAAIEQEVTYLLRLHDQLETLVSRLGGEPSPCVSREVTNLKDIVACLEERVKNLTESLRLREERVAEFFDRFTAADQENAQRLIEDTDLLRWVDILWFHTASTLITDVGRRYERLVGRFDLVGLIIAHLWRLNAAKAVEIAHALVSKQERALTGQQLIEALMWLTPVQLQAMRDACASDLSDTAEMVLAGVIGQQCAVIEEGEVIVLNARALVRPTMIQSWPVAVTQGVVPLSSLLGDYFREALGTAPTSLRGSVAEFLRRGELRAAWEAAAGDFELQQSVAEELKNKKSSTLKDYAGLLKEAQDARIHNEYIDLCLTEMENAFNAFDFHQAEQRLNELQSLVRRFKASRDPARIALVEFLQEAGLPVHDDESLEQLQQYVDALRDQYRTQRLHLLQLEHAATDEGLFPSLRDAWADLVRRLDRPAYWPSEENSRALAEAIDTFVRFILGKLRYKADDPATADTLVGRLEQWIRAQLYAGLVAEEGGRNAAIQALSDLAEEIEEFALDTHILRVVSASELTLRFPQDSIDVREQPPPAKVEDEEQEKGAQRHAEELLQAEEEYCRETKTEKTRLEPIKRGGRSRSVSIQDDAEQTVQEIRTSGPKPELICWKRNRRWIPVVEIPESLLESSKPAVFQNEHVLAEDESREGFWPLEQVDGQVAIHWSHDGVLGETKIALGENHYLLFKLSDQDPDQGRLVKFPSSGWYLVMAPEDWERDETLSGPPPAAPEPVFIRGYRAHFFSLEKDGDKKIAFRTPEGRPVVIEPRGPRFELVGARLPDVGENMGPLFGGAPPQICSILSSQSWQDVGTIVVGEEGGGKGRWRTEFTPVPGKAEQDLPPEVAARKSGWYFLRFYDANNDLTESLNFRFVGALKAIRILQPLPFPSADGHQATYVEFFHEPGCIIRPANDPAISIFIDPQTDKTILNVPPDSTCDQSRWFVKPDAGPQVEVTILIERLWWALEEEGTEPVIWQDKVLMLARDDLVATSTKTLWIKLPRKRWTDAVDVGFTREGSRSYSVKVTEDTVAIPLRDFGDAQEVQTVGTAPLQLWVQIHERAYTGILCELVVKVSCRLCEFSASIEEAIFRHIESQHLDELLRPLTYQELQASIPSLPSAIYKCPYCSEFVRSDDPSNSTSVIARHIERDCPNVTTRGRDKVVIGIDRISDVDEIRKYIIADLPRVHRCSLCSEELKEATQSDKLRHLIRSHSARLYQLQ